MKKLIALSAATVFASSAAIADIALSGSASVSTMIMAHWLHQQLMMQICQSLVRLAQQQ